MVRYLIRFSYIGTKYRGSQSQNEASPSTVVKALELALESLKPANVPKASLCSRTDKGVHALMNAAHVDLEHRTAGITFHPYVVTQVTNRYFRENNHEILTIQTNAVPDTFLVRQATKWRSYIYRVAILKPEITHYTVFPKNTSYEQYLPVCEIDRCRVVNNTLDISKVKEVLRLFHGTHNFSSFTSGLLKEPWRLPIRCVDKFEFYPIPNVKHINDPQYLNIDMWEFYIQAKAFLYNQVRRMIGTALAVGAGHLTIDDVIFLLENPGQVQGRSCKLPPPEGLFLSHIEFNEQAFVMPTEENTRRKELEPS